MKKKLFAIWTALLISMLVFSPVAAGGVSVTWGGGSIIAEGYAYGFSKDAVVITLNAKGTPYVSCFDPGNGNLVPGQNPNLVVDGTDAFFHFPVDENGKFEVRLEADADISGLTAIDLGCPNNNWTFDLDWVDWSWASITVSEASTSDTLWYKEYTCTTTPPEPTPEDYDVDCTAIKFK